MFAVLLATFTQWLNFNYVSWC